MGNFTRHSSGFDFLQLLLLYLSRSLSILLTDSCQLLVYDACFVAKRDIIFTIAYHFAH